MPKSVVDISNFISGVSQQIPELRFPAQMEEQVNGQPTIKNGFSKRYGAETIARLPTTLDDFNQWHFIDRGNSLSLEPFTTDFDFDYGETKETRRYAVAFGNANMGAVNLNGRDEDIVYVDDSLTYLTTTDPKLDLDFVTIQDYTFVLNRSIVPQMSTTQDAFRPFEALIVVAEARQHTDYHVYVNDIQVSSQSVAALGSTSSTNIVAAAIETEMKSILDADEFLVLRSGSTVYLASLTGVDFNIRAEEGYGGETLKIFKGATSKFSALPLLAIDGFRIKISNDATFDSDDFWVQYSADSFSTQGEWIESNQDGMYNTIDKTTMPHQLIHNTPDIYSTDFDDTFGIQAFSLTPVTWDKRLVGDDSSVPVPSFINTPINDITFMRNRLTFLAGENAIQSEDSHSTNFWPTTMQTILDSDPIDVGISHSKSSKLIHAVPTQEKLMLFSGNTLFTYGSGDNVLSPKSVFINPSSEVTINPNVRPFVIGSSVFFAVDKKVGTGIKELSTETTDEVMRPTDTTAHVPDYIPKDLQGISGSEMEGLLFAVSNDDLDTMYLHKFLNDEDDKRILSSWTKWTFDGTGVEINGHAAMDDTLFKVKTYTEGATTRKYLEKINLAPDFNNTSLDHPLLLDRLTTVKGIYDSTTDLTTWTLPYVETDTLKVVLDSTFSVPGAELKASSITRPTTSTVAFPGDYSAGQVYIGKTFRHSTTLTQPLLKAVADGSPKVDHSATYTVHHFTLDFYKSSSFVIEVTYKDGTVRTYPYSGFITSNTDFSVGQFNFNSDSWHVPIKVKGGRQVTVKVYSDAYVPFNPYAARWVMNITRKQGRY